MWLDIVRSCSSYFSSASLFLPDPEQKNAIWLLLKAIRNYFEATGNTIPAASHAYRKFCITVIYRNQAED
jgi:phytoene/squalene synthetase